MANNPSRAKLTSGRVAQFSCESGRSQSFLWDTVAPSLLIRATPTGRKTYAFEGRLNGKTIRIGIGTVADWTLDKARQRATELRMLVDTGQDPRELERLHQAENEAKRKRAQADALTVGEVWPRYLAEGHPKRKDAFKPRYLSDLHKMAAAGGEKKKRGEGVTRPGPIYPLLLLPIAGINEDTLKTWHDKEAKAGKHQAARALMMFRGFLRWCSAQPEYRKLVNREAGRAPSVIENLPPVTHRVDKLLEAQVAGWWASVEQLPNPVHSAYLRALVLTGARREEMASLLWENVDFKWGKLTIADKYEPTRTIPLGPYMAHVLGNMERKGPYVFHSRSLTGHLKDVRASMAKVLNEAGIEHLTFHGLRRTFTQTARRIVPAGVPAQISGQRPSAVAEGYNILTLDELRPYVEQIERRFLELAGVEFDFTDKGRKLRLVAGV